MLNVELSILLLTHKRPTLFDRCIKSVLSQITPQTEIIVNNDSCDIEEILNPNVKYFYKKFDNLSSIYEFLFLQSKGKYIYFLEDDDYLRNDFFNQEFDSDIIAGNYYPTYKPDNLLEIVNMFKDENINNKIDFLNKLNLEHLQLGQFIFNKEVIGDFLFGKDNNIHNDIRLVYHASGNSKSFRTTGKVFFYQTKDGNDNISFPDTKKDINITSSLDFLKKYEV
jgi:glycosyltransferase involved in cell wall biosynthesis